MNFLLGFIIGSFGYLLGSAIWFAHGLATGKKHRNHNNLVDYIFLPGALLLALIVRQFNK